ncbi:MAG: MFS transporter [Streptococcaceae bacterium]|jgi:UMF1 family MFS transporter|nr:MFS transporter [Streptococcaceae bacterium]
MKNFTLEERSWVMYDWANSVFATIMVAAVFPVYFTGMAGGEDTLGSFWWAIGLVVARITVGLSAPFIGAIIDFEGYKKKLFIIALITGTIFTALTALVSSWQMLLIGYVLANIFWSICNQIYDSFLPDVTTKERMDNVSATGFAYGYIGGSTIPFVISILLIMFGPYFGIDATLAVRLSVIMTAIWWLAFSFPIIKNVHHQYGVPKPESGLLKETMSNTVQSFKRVFQNKAVFYFLIAYFFYIDGVGTVINMATAYGSELGLNTTGMLGALFVTQVVAFPFSIIFGRLSKKVHSIRLIIAAICIYLFICIVGFFMGFGLEQELFGLDVAIALFWVLAFLVGTVQGGIQAISRSTYGKLVPVEQSGEYFGFFEIFGRFSAILGPGLYALILNTTGRPSVSMLSITVLFSIGLVVLLRNRKVIFADMN